LEREGTETKLKSGNFFEECDGNIKMDVRETSNKNMNWNEVAL
jgi:hypothetical protein